MRKSEVLAAEAVSCLNKALIHLKDIWEEIGIPEEQRLQRTNTVKNHIRGLLEMMIAEEQSLKHRLEKSIESSRTEIQQLCLELDLPLPQEESGQSVLQSERDLRTRVDFLLKEKSKRVQDLRDLLRQDQDLAEILGSEPFSIDQNSVPSTRQLEDFRQHLANQREEQSRREVQFQTLKDQILVLFSDLDHNPDSSLERDLIHSDLDVFCLSCENLSTLGLLLTQLQQRRADLEEQCNLFQDQIQSLWNQLQVPDQEQDAFNKQIPQDKIHHRVQVLHSEAERLQQLKLNNIKSVSERIRAEISDFWDKCFCSEEQRLEFILFYSEEVSERVLEALEAELQRLRAFYRKHQAMFEGVQSWIDQWELFLELERKALDPSRFTNRGGNLLREERQRTELSKRLPKLERVLRTQISRWEQTESRPFLVKGLDFLQFVEQQWNLLQDQREHERLQRHMKKARQTEEDMLYGTSVRTPTKRRFIGTNSPSKTQNCSQSPGFRTQGPGKSLNRTRRVLLSGCSLSTNSTLRSVQGQPRPPLCSAQVPLVRTPVRSRPPQPRVPALNSDQNQNLDPVHIKDQNLEQKENQPRSLVPSESPQTLSSVASTYSQFLRDLSESNTKVQNHVLNSTDL